MGVIAFPNPNKDERVFRFIDSEYHTLFTIKDCLLYTSDSAGHVLHFGTLPQYVPDLVMELLDWAKTTEVHMRDS